MQQEDSWETIANQKLNGIHIQATKSLWMWIFLFIPILKYSHFSYKIQMGQLQFGWHHPVSNVGMALNMTRGFTKNIYIILCASQ
jgi:hypothetical protein